MLRRTSRVSKSPSTSRIVMRVRARLPVAPFITSFKSRIVLFAQTSQDSAKFLSNEQIAELSVGGQGSIKPGVGVVKRIEFSERHF
eukprot:3330092-Pleurochrysis_carterae.AAC.1